jgi:hypothetical protein
MLTLEGRFTRGQLFDLARVWFWLLTTVVAYAIGWLESVTFVSLISLWALVETSWAAYRAESAGSIKDVDAKLDVILKKLDEQSGWIDYPPG